MMAAGPDRTIESFGGAGKMLAVLGMCLFSTLAQGQSVTVGPGASLSLDGGAMNLGCGDLTIEGQVSIGSGSAGGIGNIDISGGTLTMDAGAVSLSGDWRNSGTFSAGTGQVVIEDGCGLATSNLSGDNDFHASSCGSRFL